MCRYRFCFGAFVCAILIAAFPGCRASARAKAGVPNGDAGGSASEGPRAAFVWAADVFDGSAKTGSDAQLGADNLKRVLAVRVAPDGRIWVASATGKFFIFDASGKLLDSWGSKGSGKGEFLFAMSPAHMQADLLFLADGSFYVTDYANARIQHFGPDRVYLGEWGSGDGVPSTPNAIARTPEGELLVVFDQRPELQRFSPSGKFLGMMDLGLRNPKGLAIDPSGRIWVTENNFRDGQNPEDPEVRVFEPDGKPAFDFGKADGAYSGLDRPEHLAIDGGGHVFVSDVYHHRVAVFDRKGVFIMEIGGRGKAGGQFDYTKGLALDGDGTLYAGDWVGSRVEKFSLSGLPPPS